MQKILKKSFTLAIVAAIGSLAFIGCDGNTVSYDKYANADMYTVGTASYAATEVKKLQIDWVAGSVEVEQSASNEIQVVEESSSEKEEERMRYFLDGDVLRVKYCQSGLRGTINERNKNLLVEIPAGIALEVESTSAGITLGVIEAKEISLESVSGNITAERMLCEKSAEIETVSGKTSIGEISANDLAIESVSGAVSVSKLSVNALDVETTSGELTFGVEKPMTAEVETTSAAVIFAFAEGLGATVHFETATGKFNSERAFEKVGARYDVAGTAGQEACHLDVDTFSGNLYIK